MPRCIVLVSRTFKMEADGFGVTPAGSLERLRQTTVIIRLGCCWDEVDDHLPNLIVEGFDFVGLARARASD